MSNEISPLYGARKVHFRERINDNCKSCVYDEMDEGTWRMQVARCEIVLCEFWDIRPKSESTKL